MYMVQAMIQIDDRTNRVLNIVKAQHGLKDKSQAIDFVVKAYEESYLQESLRPGYDAKLKRIQSEKHLSREEFDRAVK
ncbi:MAG: antitoxin [Nanoarchaeota archaeon]